MASGDYVSGDVKQDPETKAVAVRTIFPDIEALADRQWGIMTVDNGGHFLSYEKVKHWLDMEATPGDPDPEPEPELGPE